MYCNTKDKKSTKAKAIIYPSIKSQNTGRDASSDLVNQKRADIIDSLIYITFTLLLLFYEDFLEFCKSWKTVLKRSFAIALDKR